MPQDKPTREQKPLYNRFVSLLDNESFRLDVESLRSSDVNILQPTYTNMEQFDDGTVNADESPSPLHQVMIKHKLPIIMEDFVHHYVTHNELALDRLRNGVYILDHKTTKASGSDEDETHNYQAWYVSDTFNNKYIELSLAIPVHATITQITDTLAQHQQFIKDRQKEANNGERLKRIKLSPKAFRNVEIMRLYKQGYKPRQILWELPENMRDNLTGPDIAKIVYKLKNKK